MAAGFYCLNDFGTTLIDDTSRNLVFIGRGSSTVLFTSPQGQNHWRWNLTQNGPFSYFNAEAPVIAFRSSSYVSAVRPRIDLVNYGSPTLVGRAEADPFTTGAIVSWAVLDTPFQPLASSSGAMQVFDAAGKLCFDSRLKHAVIAFAVIPTALNVEYVQALVAGREYMFVSPFAYCKIVSDTAYVKALAPEALNVPTLIIDVTGY